ncbi:hypothetical protein F443_17457 [Phytophthora nicotianae P1569]|uniref:Pectate lyase n=1 Tax=Phytophthora nicotianae P1569 TaxID=1317065 RepID=V9ED81_PHYNI|nr:hypothetical protein F443_17457 [Phytophthora nicotianae P1569]
MANTQLAQSLCVCGLLSALLVQCKLLLRWSDRMLVEDPALNVRDGGCWRQVPHAPCTILRADTDEHFGDNLLFEKGDVYLYTNSYLTRGNQVEVRGNMTNKNQRYDTMFKYRGPLHLPPSFPSFVLLLSPAAIAKQETQMKPSRAALATGTE